MSMSFLVGNGGNILGIMDIWILLAMWSSFSIFSFLSLIALKRIWLLATALIIRNRSTSPSSWRILMKLLSLSRLANISFSGMNTLIAQPVLSIGPNSTMFFSPSYVISIFPLSLLSIAALSFLRSLESLTDDANSLMLVFITSVSAGLTIICPVRLTTVLKALG